MSFNNQTRLSECQLRLIRDTFTTKSTIGKLYVNDIFFCYTLEDVARAENVKIDGETAIPTGVYKVAISNSSRFRRPMPMIFTESNGYELKNKGISFKGIRIHGGNKPENTEGCILVAFNKGENSIWGTAEKELVNKIQSFDNIGIEIINKPS